MNNTPDSSTPDSEPQAKILNRALDPLPLLDDEPTVLMRSPYARGSIYGRVAARHVAALERLGWTKAEATE